MAKNGKRESRLLKIEKYNEFQEVKDWPASSIRQEVLDTVASLDEREQLEPYILDCLHDPNRTPHGPTEIVDILTHKLHTKKEDGIAAVIIKGKSFKTVRPKDVSHQIYRLKKISGLRFSILAVTGNFLDQAKEQFVNTCIEIECDYSIFDKIDLARLFVAKGFICPRDGKIVSAGRCICGYSPANRFLNILQDDALKNLANAHELGQSAGLIIMPTGSGKTRVAAEDAKRVVATRILYVAHTHEILDVANSELSAVFGKRNVKYLRSPADFDRLRKANIATIQLLRSNLPKLMNRKIDYLVVDEFHHVAAKTYRDLLAQLKPKFLLGLTATPFRGDKQDILELCHQNVVVNYELRAGIEKGVLCPYHYYGCFDDIDYTNIRHNGTSYNIRDLEKALIIPERDAAIILKWEELALDKPTIAFCCSHKHARRVCQSFKEHGINAALYISDTHWGDRREIIKKLAEGQVKVVCTVDVFNEGVDLPFVESLLFLRPTESKRIFFQQLGRGLRKSVGKPYVTVIDFIGNFRNAFKIVEYQSLTPAEEEDMRDITTVQHSAKAMLNLPLGCTVSFDQKVIDVFAQQTLDPARATRHNIGKILIHQYLRLAEKMDRQPTKKDVDRYLLLHSGLYIMVFGSWPKFWNIITSELQR